MNRYVAAALTTLSAAVIAGCGSNSGTNSPASSVAASTVSVSGAVADGYLINATVFMDKNLNYQLDTGEPSAVTDQNGAYTLAINAADLGKYPIVALAVKGVTIDKDTNTTVAGDYLLSMHAVSVAAAASGVSGTVSNFISPMSSQIRELMETGKYTSIQQAMDALRTQLGLPAGTNMMSDYIAARNAAMHTAAQNMVALMSSQTSLVTGANGRPDVNRYRGMMGTIYSNLPAISGTNSQIGIGNMGTMINYMNTNLAAIPVGMPFRNMSTAYRGPMMWR